MRVELNLLDKDSKRPLHQQLSDLLRGAIRSGVYLPGERMETERDFMRHAQLSQPTVARAFKSLCDEGLIFRKTGAGTFVRPHAPQRPPGPRRVGVTYYDLHTAYFERLYHGLEAVAHEEGIELVAMPYGHADREDQALLALEQDKVDAIVVGPSSSEAAQQQLIRLSRTGMPMVAINAHLPQLHCDTVGIDHEMSGHLAAHYVLEEQHRRIAMLITEVAYPYTAYRDMVAGARAACRPFDVALDDGTIVRLPLMFHEARDAGPREALLRVFDRPEAQRPTALICATDGLARYAYKVLGEKGWRLPNDISLTGASDMPVAAQLDPPLTTVAWPVERLGRNALRMLVDRFAHPDRPPIHRLLDVNLVVRRSVVMPPTVESR